MKNFLTFFALAMACAITKAQAPPNDNACQAILLTVDTVCNYQTFTTENATASVGSTAPSCAGFVAGTTADVWFRAVVPAGGVLTFDMQGGSLDSAGMAVYRGNSCIGLIILPGACDGNSSAEPNMPKVTVSGLNPGTSVWVRVWGKSNASGTFGICATIPVPPPANDEPCNAIELTVGSSCNYQTFTNASASLSTGVGAPVCGGFLGGDVWFKVTMPASGGLLFDSQTGSITDAGMAVYTGASCSSISQAYLGCDDNSSPNGDMPSLFITGQPPGSTLWVRFWEKGNNNNGTFGICVTNIFSPSNDDPCNAATLTVGTECIYQTFTNEYATGTTGVPSPACAEYISGDVWFKVIVPGSGLLFFDTHEGAVTDGGLAIYSGIDCGNLTLLACDDTSSVNGSMPALRIGNQPPGSTLWVRFWEKGGDNNGTFGICVKTLQPSSDRCNALPLSVGTVCNYQFFTNENATGIPAAPAPTCADYAGADVWFKIIVPASGWLLFDSQRGDITDGGMAVYSGTGCDSLTLIGCDDNSSTNDSMPALTIYNQPPGSTLWIRFWGNGGNNNGTFGFCVTNVQVPFNDNPCNAIALTVDTICRYQTFSSENATGSGVPHPQCSDYGGADIWFKVVVPAGGSLFIDTEAGVITDAAMAVYTGSDCNTLTRLACDKNSSLNDSMPALAIDSQPPGTTLWIRFWGEGGDNNSTFRICVKKSLPLGRNVTYTKYPVDFGNVIQFTDSSTTSGGFPIVSWHWEFGHGDSSNLQSPATFYGDVGSFTAYLTTKNSNNEYQTKVSTIQLSITIGATQKMNFCPSIDSGRISSNVLTGNVQWQMRTDSSGFIDIGDSVNFSGTNTPVLTLTNIPYTWRRCYFRCKSDEGYYSWETTVTFINEFTGTTDDNWENPANWSCGGLPDANTDVVINGTATLNSNASCRTLYVNPGATFTISPGYTLTITQ